MEDRLTRLRSLLKQHQLDAMVLNPGPTLTYLTGLQFHLMERPTLAIFTAAGETGLILPALEKQKLEGLPFPLQVFSFEDDPAGWGQVFQTAFGQLIAPAARCAVEPNRLRYLELMLMQPAAPTAVWTDGSAVLEALRMCKDQAEIGKMRRAAEIAQEALLRTLRITKPGMTEKQVAAELVINLFRCGSDVELPFEPIVSSGGNTANPHAAPSERELRDGDLLLLDWGAGYLGYFSDITRTFTIGTVSEELRHIGEVVQAANARGRETGRPGITAGQVDQAAREVIEQAGYGPWFTHRLGHGLGIEAHEAPYIHSANSLRLQPGMTFTVEPGIYLPERGGVRIEDDVVVSESGLVSLTDLPREVRPLESMWG